MYLAPAGPLRVSAFIRYEPILRVPARAVAAWAGTTNQTAQS